MSLFGEYPCQHQPIAPIAVSFTTGTVSAVLCLVTVVGNMLVVLAIFIDPYKDLKTPFNYFVANLAMCDLFVGIVIDPMSVSYLYYEGALQKFPAQLIFLYVPYLASCTASVLSLAALTVDRYWAITSPLSYRLKLNPKRAGFIALLIWTLSILPRLHVFQRVT